MRLHTNTLTYSDVTDALQSQKDAYHIARSVMFATLTEHGSRTHRRAFEIALESLEKLPGDGRRFRNSGGSGAREDYAATWDEWGYFIAELFSRDPSLTFGEYTSPAVFRERTEWLGGVPGRSRVKGYFPFHVDIAQLAGEPADAIRVQREAPRNTYSSGYGAKVPTAYSVRLTTEHGARWHRVYTMVYGNSGSAYVLRRGAVFHIGTDLEYALMSARDADALQGTE